MTVSVTTGLRGLEDMNQAAAGGTFNRTRIVNNVSVTGAVTLINASNFPILATADALAVTNAGGAATFPGPAITEGVHRFRAPVATIVALRALTTTPTADQLCFCTEKIAPYAWDATSVAVDDGNLVVQQTGIVTGRWVKTHAGGADTAIYTVANDPFFWLFKGV